MATYFHGNSDIQGGGDGLQTLILMNPAYVGYSDAQPTQPPSNLVFLNANSTGNPAATFHHAPPSQTQHFVGIPLQGANSASAASPQQNVRAGFLPRVHYNLYNRPIDMGAAARDVTRSDQQGLSLSLSSHQQPHGHGYVSIRSETDVPPQPLTTAVSPPRTHDIRVPAQGAGTPSSASGIFNGVQDVLRNSKYLKAAQQLLDQVVNVGKGAKTATESFKGKSELHINLPGTETAAASRGDTPDGGAKRGGELTTAERQEIQMKKAKLVNMLEEVEQRYRQYHHQMQIVISWFEQAAGFGSAKTYTALALKTISKQFRCLKDAILGQIRGANKSLREGDDALDLDGKIEGSRLKYVDNQIRQQRGLQQLGMIQHNAWRPQRGLPERSVSVLRAWLFQHFLHPYPKDSDKVMLAKQTGLTRSQVSNWFINARVRLWKPMVEEMYTEDMKEHENNGTDDKARKSKSEQHQDNPTAKSTAAKAKSPGTDHTHTHTHSHSQSQSHMKLRHTQGSPKKLRHIDILHSPASIASINMDTKPPNNNNNSEHIPMKFDNQRQSRDGLTLMGAPTNFIGGFGSYPIADLGRFGVDQFHTPYSGNGVSLTLGLPHCENLSISGVHQTFLPNQTMQLGRGVERGETNDFSGIDTPNAHSTNVYENINRKSFGAQLLPDFVALTEQS